MATRKNRTRKNRSTIHRPRVRGARKRSARRLLACGCDADLIEVPGAYDEMIIDKITAYGVFLQAVRPGPGDVSRTSWVYTVGLARLEIPHPEFITFGLPNDAAASALNHLAIDGVINGGERFAAGPLPGFFANGLDGWLVEVTDTHTEFFAMSNRIFAPPPSTPVQGLQLVWPDAANRFPWEDGHRAGPLAALQPLLGVPLRST